MQKKSKTAAPRSVKSESVSPDVSVYIADDFREEVRGTITAVGLHTTRSLTVSVPEDEVFGKDKPVAIHSLSFLVAMKGFVGPKVMSFSFTLPSKPDELISTRSQRHTFNSVNDGVNMIIRGQPFLFHEFGPRSIVVDVGDYREIVHFEILRRALPLSAEA